jgi:hypothetical protein
MDDRVDRHLPRGYRGPIHLRGPGLPRLRIPSAGRSRRYKRDDSFIAAESA